MSHSCHVQFVYFLGNLNECVERDCLVCHVDNVCLTEFNDIK